MFVMLALAVSCADVQDVEFPATGKGSGVVKRLDYENRMITIDHERVPPIMDALTMAYPVRDVHMMDSIADGDSVAFTLVENSPGDFLITSLRKL